MYYLVTATYIGPNQMERTLKEELLDVAYIQTSPGITNQSHEERASGWLGTTSDWDSTAQGAFASIHAAMEHAESLGYDSQISPGDYRARGIAAAENTIVLVAQDDTLAQWDAEEYWYDSRDELGVTADMDETALHRLANRLDAKARHDDGCVVHGTENVLQEILSELKARGA